VSFYSSYFERDTRMTSYDTYDCIVTMLKFW